MIKKPSFLERITGSVKVNSSKDDGFNDHDTFDNDETSEQVNIHQQGSLPVSRSVRELPLLCFGIWKTDCLLFL